MKKFFSVILCAALIVALFAACGSTNNGGTTADTPATTQNNNNETANTNEATTDSSGGNRDEYRVQIIRPATQFTDSSLTAVGQVIKDKFNIEFEIIAYTGDMRERQNLMLASGDFNEIQYMQRDDIVTSYIGAGALLDLEQFKDIMPNFWRVYGDVQIPFWRAVGDGTLYKWENFVPREGEMDIETNDIHVRTDVLEYYGWPNPVSASEWVAFLRQAKIDFPEIDGQPTVGITSCFAESWGLQGTMPIMYEKGDTYLPLSNEGYTFNVKTDQFEDYFKNPYVKESFAFFNTLYREGLLDEEAFTDTFDRMEQKAISGTALAIWYAGWFNRNAVPYERQYFNLPVQSDTSVAQGQKRLIRMETTRNFESYGITTNAKHPERLAELIDWAMSDEGQITVRNGVEGVHWIRDGSGKREMTELGIAAKKDVEGADNLTVGLNFFSMFLGHYNLKAADGQFHDLFDHAEIYDEHFLTPRQKEAVAGLGWKNSKGWYIDNMAYGHTGLAGSIYIDSTTDLGRLHQQMTEVRTRWTSRLVMASSEAEFESLYQQAMEEYDRLDHESVINEYNRLYAEAKAKLG